MTQDEFFSKFSISGQNLICSANAIYGGIIDKTIATNEYFVIFNNENISVETIFFNSKYEAMDYFYNEIKSRGLLPE